MSLVRTEIRDNIGTITLENTKKRNALSRALVDDLVHALDGMHELNARVVILRAPAGSTVWSAGHDIHELPTSGRDPLAYDDALLVAIRKIQYLPIPVIAMIEGAVWGGACDLAFSCDILVGCPTTSFTMTPAKIGVPYNVTGILHFMNMLPVNTVREMFFTALPMRAETAYRLGVLNDLFPVEELEACTYEKAAVIARNSPLSIASIKEQIRLLSMAHPLTPNMFELIQGLRRKVYDSYDYREGIQSFLEKRPPVFTGA
ncbi:methylmalonyl-CoA decarboxylase [Acidobacteria bacterium ACD]|nr:MAG: methylmalonyl-CoA decarboxylase [Acidobacteriota bacterium]MCE7959925.1 methylmalonyl-CoA decarboxylase [Acidobacteria bacterium ACB2]MDL1950251.1 methylmalonyl-CoA decarboxylase [Acidobacteria bacterium ACD]